MARPKKNVNQAKASLSGMPKPPLIYISDPTTCCTYGRDLSSLIPDAVYSCVQGPFNGFDTKSPMVLLDKKGDCDTEEKVKRSRILQGIAISQGVNFVSVNIIEDMSKLCKTAGFGANHLDIAANSDTVTKIYQWLCELRNLYIVTHANWK